MDKIGDDLGMYTERARRKEERVRGDQHDEEEERWKRGVQEREKKNERQQE